MENVKEKDIQIKANKSSVLMEKVCSMEYYKKENGEIEQVLKNINFKAKLSETWVVTGDSLFDIKLLLEIMANTKPYQKGKCVLVETGMMRKKRIILNHTFYIGNTNMPFNNMKVLEYLMLVTGKKKGKSLERQKMLLELLISLDMSYIALSEINLLKDEEKSIVTLLVSAISDSDLIVFNIPMLKFEEKHIKSIKKISEYMASKNKTLIFSTMDKDIANKVCENILILNKGEVIYKGDKKDFIEKYDKVIYKIKSMDNKKLLKYLEKEHKAFNYKIEDDFIEIYEYKKITEDKRMVYDMVIDSEIEILNIEKNILNVKNAYRELVKEHDLQ